MVEGQPRVPLIARAAPWREVHSALRRAQKSSRNAPAYSRWVNRPLGRVFAATGYRLGMTPNQISLISAVFTYSGIAVVAVLPPSGPMGVVVAALLIIGYALDSADGQVARLQGGGTLAGEWLDHVLDSIKIATIHLAVALMWFRSLNGWATWTTIIPLAFSAVACVWFFTVIATELLLRGGKPAGGGSTREGKPAIWTSLVGLVLDYGFLAATMVLLGWLDLWRGVYTALAIANAGFLAAQLVRWYRRVASATA